MGIMSQVYGTHITTFDVLQIVLTIRLFDMISSEVDKLVAKIDHTSSAVRNMVD
jgi:hypothetical protein